MKVCESLYCLISDGFKRRIWTFTIGIVATFLLVASPGWATETITYTYDALGRMIEAGSVGTVNQGQVTAITYDDAGNRSNYQVTGAPARISISDASVTEGGSLAFNVTISSSPTSTVTVDYATADDTATAGSDYDAVSDTLTFSSNSPLTQTVVVTTLDDSAYEGETESLFVNLSSVTGDAVIEDGQGLGTIEENDPELAILSIEADQALEGDDLVFIVTLSEPQEADVTVDVSTLDGAAIAGTDYTALSDQLTFSPGEVEKVVVVSTIQDDQAEEDEDFQLVMSSVVGTAEFQNDRAAGTIIDEDTPVEISISDASVIEGGDLIFTVDFSRPSHAMLGFHVDVIGGTAEGGRDYESLGSYGVKLDWGISSDTIRIPTNDDTYIEGDETLDVVITSDPVSTTIVDGTGRGTIIDNDDDPAVTFSISDATVTEGGNLEFTVTKRGFSFSTISLDYATENGSALAGSDYAAASGSLRFSWIEYSKTITIPTTDDSIHEGTEAMSLVLANSSGDSGIEDYIGAGTIEDDDEEVISDIAVADASVIEGQSLNFQVSLSQPSASAITVDFATVDDSAAAGSDYTSVSRTLTFNSGETLKTVSVTTIDDSDIEGDEALKLSLSNATGISRIVGSLATGTIVDNDDPVEVTVSDASAAEGGSVSFDVVLSEAPSAPVTVDYATADGSGVAGSDYVAAAGTLTFGVGEVSKTVDVVIVDDSEIEADENFTFVLSNVVGNATISNATALGTITDNDAPAATVSVSDASATEGGNVAFTVTLSEAVSSAVTVDYATSDGTAEAGSDYTAASGVLTFAAGQTSKVIPVATIDDATIDAATETFSLSLSNPSSRLGLGASSATGTITENDIGLVISNGSGSEGGAIRFNVTRSGATSGPVSVNYVTSDQTATAGADYTSASGVINFSAGETQKFIKVVTIDDTLTEEDERFRVTLSSPTSGATLTRAVGMGTIKSDEVGFYIEKDLSGIEVGFFSFRVMKVGHPTGTTTVDYATSDGTATAGSDYTAKSGRLSFGRNVNRMLVTVLITSDRVDEDDETLFLNLLSSSAGTEIMASSAMGTIRDDD